MTLFYYTSTGNSLQVAKAFGGQCISIPAVMKGQLREFSDDVIGVVTPNHHGKAPQQVLDFLTQVKLKADYKFLIVNYGLLNANSIQQLVDLAKKNGNVFDYANKIWMVENYFKIFNVGWHEKSLKWRNIDGNISRLVSDVNNRVRKIHSAMFLLKGLAFISDSLLAVKAPYKRFRVEKAKCTSCGTCVKVCPVDNIKLDANYPVFGDKCVLCGACTHNCPQNAIRFKGERTKSRYRNANVKLSEIVKANNSVCE